MVVVQVRMEPTIEDECSGMVEAQREGSRSSTVAVGSRQEVVGAMMSDGIEEVITDDGVIVGVLVDPLHGISSVNGNSVMNSINPPML